GKHPAPLDHLRLQAQSPSSRFHGPASAAPSRDQAGRAFAPSPDGALVNALIAFLAGALLALMVHCNALLAKHATPLLASWAAHGLGAAAAFLFAALNAPKSSSKTNAPAWSYLGGLPGAFTVVLAGVTINGGLGLPGSVAVMLVGQVLFGWVC